MSDKALSWLQINNWVPLIVSAIMITVSFGTLITRISIIETKLDYITALLKTHDEAQLRVVNDLNQIHKELISLEAIHPDFKIP